MEDKKSLQEMQELIKQFREMFKDNPIEQIKDGTWLSKVIRFLLKGHAEKVNANYFRKKYVGLDNERKAYMLVKVSAGYTSIVGGLAASAITGSEIATFFSGGTATPATLPTIGGALIGEISAITYLQLKMIYDISIVLNAPLDRDDPEDMLTIFWLSLGVNKWEEVSNIMVGKAGPRSAEYLGRKALRSGVRDGLKAVAAKFGGTELAKKITECAILKLIVPGVNIVLASSINYAFTKKLGDVAINSLKNRGACINTIKKLMNFERYFQLISIPLVYQLGIADEPKKKMSKAIEIQSNIVKKLNVLEEEEELISDLIALDIDEFYSLVKDIKDREAAILLGDIAIITYVISAKNDEKFKLIMAALNIQDFEKKIARYNKYFGKDNRKKKKETESNTGIFRRKGRNNIESTGEGKGN